jgi:beta-galactosidase
MRDVQGRLREWRRLGLDGVFRHAVSATCRPQRDGSVRIRLETALLGADAAVTARHRQEIAVDASGVLRFEERFEIPKEWDDIPRVGVVMALPGEFERVEWLGLGPHETYPDRRASGRFGRFRRAVTEQYVPFVVPQEHGLHVETRWLTLATADGASVRVEGNPPFAFSASHFRAEDLADALHTPDLVPRPETVLHLDAAHRGLGTASCGPDVLPRHRVRAGRHRLVWTLASGG